MSVTVKAGLLALCAILLLPVCDSGKAPEPEPLLLVVQAAAPAQQEASVCVLRDGAEEQTALDTYLTQVVLSELPASFAPEAMKAQAVAARTFALRQCAGGKHGGAVCADSACCQACRSMDELRASLADSFDSAWQLAHEAVTATQNEVLTYDGALIDAVYFSCSGGSTEAAAAVWGAEVPYLQSVESPGEQDAARYHSVVTFTPAELAARLQTLAPEADCTAAPECWAGPCTYTAGGGVDTLVLCGTPISGTQARRLFSLNSTRFTLSYTQGLFRFDVLGYGHRVGMSQYGAQAIAQLGFGYKTILRYYYRGASISQWQT